MCAKTIKSKKVTEELAPEKFEPTAVFGWIKKYTNPWSVPELINEEKSKGGLKQSLSLVAFFQVVNQIAVVLAFLIGSVFANATAPINLPRLVLQSVVSAIVAIVIFYIMSGVIHIISRLLGGKSSYAQQCYLLAILNACVVTISSPLMLLVFVPFVGAVVQIILLIVSIYSFYPIFQVIRNINEFSKFKAAIVLVALFLVTFIFLTILITVLGPPTAV